MRGGGHTELSLLGCDFLQKGFGGNLRADLEAQHCAQGCESLNGESYKALILWLQLLRPSSSTVHS